MSKRGIVIALAAHSEVVQHGMEDLLGAPSASTTWSREFPGIAISLEDVTQAAAHAVRFLEEIGDSDEAEAWRDFDSAEFPSEVTLTVSRPGVASDIIVVLADSIARHLTHSLRCDAIVSIDGGYVSFASYRDGRRLRLYSGASATDDACGWVPRDVSKGS